MTASSAVDRLGRALAGALGWAFRETGRMAPGGLGALGASRRAALIALDGEGQAGAPAGAVRSLLGRWRHAARPGRDEALVLLHPDAVLRRTVTLSRLAARDPLAAARLQAATLSPIRPEDAVFAIDRVRRTPDGAAAVELAIARRADVQSAAAAAAQRGLRWRVAADFGADGPAFVFSTGRPKRAVHPALAAILAGLSVIAALTALDVRLARDGAALSSQRDALLAEARTAREAASETGQAAGYPVLSDVLRAVAGLEAEAFEAIRVDGRRVSAVTAQGGVIETEAAAPAAETAP
jgi:hypothetical protein